MLHVTAANDGVNHVDRPAASFSDQAGDAKTGLTQRLGNLLTFIFNAEPYQIGADGQPPFEP